MGSSQPCCLYVTLKRSKLLLTKKTVTLTVRLNEVLVQMHCSISELFFPSFWINHSYPSMFRNFTDDIALSFVQKGSHEIRKETIFILVACSSPTSPSPFRWDTSSGPSPSPPPGHAWNIHSPCLCLPHAPSALRYRRADCSISIPYWEAWTGSLSDGCHWEIILVETETERDFHFLTESCWC